MPPLVDGEMTLDSGLRRKDVPGIMRCPKIFDHMLLDLAAPGGPDAGNCRTGIGANHNQGDCG